MPVTIEMLHHSLVKRVHPKTCSIGEVDTINCLEVCVNPVMDWPSVQGGLRCWERIKWYQK